MKKLMHWSRPVALSIGLCASAGCGSDGGTESVATGATGGVGAPITGGSAAIGGGVLGGVGGTGESGGSGAAIGVMGGTEAGGTGATGATGGSGATGAIGGVGATGASGGTGAIGGTGATGGNGGTGGTGPTGGTNSGVTGGTGSVPGTPVGDHGQLSVSGTQLVDRSAQPIQLKGPSSMWLNWENNGYARDRAGVQFMRDDWKATVIRAAMGIEPDGAYLSEPATAEADARAVIDNAIALGMYVIIDWHDHNAHLHADQAVAFFEEMARDYGDLPNVIYEPYNEPLDVEWATIKPYHARIVAAIRAIDPDNIIVLGTPNWSQYVDEAAADKVAGTNLMYTLHFYSCSHTAWLRTRADTALSRGLPLFVTEWGATHADGGTASHPDLCLEEAQLWHDWMNRNRISWTAWKFDDCADKTCYFVRNTPTGGSWTDSQLNGHAPFVRDRMRE